MQNKEDVADRIREILHLGWDGEGLPPTVLPHARLTRAHGIDTSFFDQRAHHTWMAPHNYVVQAPADDIFRSIESASVPSSLMHAALNMFGDSIVAYYDQPRSKFGPFRYYPAVLMMFLAGFEAWVRILSELLVATVPTVPSPVVDALLERRSTVDRSGRIDVQPDRRNTLERFYLLVMYGCNVKLSRGDAPWQSLEKAMNARNALVHYDTKEVPSLSTKQLGAHLEAILVALIHASAVSKRTLFRDQFEHYQVLMDLLALATDFEERSIHKGWPREPTIVYCPFDGVDTKRFPEAMPKVSADAPVPSALRPRPA